ncbi:MAG: AbrB family transcriptional regulator [Roseofilum sp. SBFL]|uniref:AbrB family transcriptional regulator n=1 Tax=unclassified Roseofilum TaxID=2620099 RepID=UPI001B0F3290|nr:MULTISPECIES: AbrB family transcriptional regulator [unclassified Roseofilum]MBP0012805.1 AbrB family transcriptional regulator [Roseofilum sp. SID3]MBP0025183.1 AbrB family transcriptional regulator [Roseofilum sp. SID2]MBP0039797.1 AbrB family transcriptional regulator [Roseofilum sp. SID1]MBP0044370.1 AbrB family transcriptional regulator [Roseofilum sp. SBFL]
MINLNDMVDVPEPNQPEQLSSGEVLQDKLKNSLSYIGLVAIASLTAVLLTQLHIPVSWLVGPMIFGLVYSLFKGEAQPLPPIFSILGQAIIALTTATRFSFDTLILAKEYALPLLGCITITGILSILNGYLLSRWAGIDKATSLLGCIPGAGPTLVALSEDLGGDAIAVAFLQYLRILMVSVIVPSLVTFSSSETIGQLAILPEMSTPSATLPPILNLGILALCGILGLLIGRGIKLPAAVFLGPFFLGLITFWILPYPLHVPDPIFAASLLLFGLSIGLKFDRQVAQTLVKSVVIQLGLVTILIAVCLGIGYEFHQLTHIDTLTAILGTTPGGISAITATVIEIGGNVGLVVAMQMTRMFLILLLSPWLAASLLSAKPGI